MPVINVPSLSSTVQDKLHANDILLGPSSLGQISWTGKTKALVSTAHTSIVDNEGLVLSSKGNLAIGGSKIKIGGSDAELTALPLDLADGTALTTAPTSVDIGATNVNIKAPTQVRCDTDLFIVKDATGTTERFRVDGTGVTLPSGSGSMTVDGDLTVNGSLNVIAGAGSTVFETANSVVADNRIVLNAFPSVETDSGANPLEQNIGSGGVVLQKHPYELYKRATEASMISQGQTGDIRLAVIDISQASLDNDFSGTQTIVLDAQQYNYPYSISTVTYEYPNPASLAPQAIVQTGVESQFVGTGNWLVGWTVCIAPTANVGAANGTVAHPALDTPYNGTYNGMMFYRITAVVGTTLTVRYVGRVGTDDPTSTGTFAGLPTASQRTVLVVAAVEELMLDMGFSQAPRYTQVFTDVHAQTGALTTDSSLDFQGTLSLKSTFRDATSHTDTSGDNPDDNAQNFMNLWCNKVKTTEIFIGGGNMGEDPDATGETAAFRITAVDTKGAGQNKQLIFSAWGKWGASNTLGWQEAMTLACTDNLYNP